MAVRKATRSNPQAQPKHGNSNPKRPRHNPHHLKSELFDTLHQFNRGFATTLSALDRLGRHHAGSFSRGCLTNYRNRMQALRATANRDLLRLIAGREEREAERLGAAKTK